MEMMNLYEQYRKKSIDLALFGIERREEDSDYFCTPKGAEIIGWTGVDGIHYCTLKAFGEKVFAVQPMGDPGKHAFPVAESFEDFLRLLMACGHEAHLEQAHAWSSEQYAHFVRENPITAETADLIAGLQEQYGLTTMEDPFGYLKAVYDGFDFSKIPYKDDYYEYVPREAMPLPREWKVFFSLHDPKGERAGVEMPLRARFSWGGYEWCVPSAYLCAKGLVLDLFAQADSEAVHAFLFKWAYAEADDTTLTSEQREQLRRENPLAFDFSARVTVNGKTMTEKQGMGDVWVRGYELYATPAMQDMLSHYGLDPEQCWLWRRISFPWATKTKPAVKTMQLHVEQRPIPLHGEHFRVDREGQQIKFTHPFTKSEHTLTVTEYSADTMNLDRAASDGYEHPTHLVKMAYTLSPDLPSRQFSVSDTRHSDQPRRIKAGSRTYDFESSMTVMVPIIGGADGPTAVAFGVPRSEKTLHAACSALTFEPQSEVEWRMTFRVKTAEDKTVDLLEAGRG